MGHSLVVDGIKSHISPAAADREMVPPSIFNARDGGVEVQEREVVVIKTFGQYIRQTAPKSCYRGTKVERTS